MSKAFRFPPKKICGWENGRKIYGTENRRKIFGTKRKIVFHKRGQFAENVVVRILFFPQSSFSKTRDLLDTTVVYLALKKVIQQKHVTRQAP